MKRDLLSRILYPLPETGVEETVLDVPEETLIKPRRLWRHLRWLFWPLFLLLMLAALAITLPWPLPARIAFIERLLSEKLGCHVRVGKARVWPLFGEIAVNDVELDYSAQAERFAFAGLETPVWRLNRAEVELQPKHLLSRRKPIDVNVILVDPDPIIVRARGDSFETFPPFLKSSGKRSAGAKTWRLASLTIERGDLELIPPDTYEIGRKRLSDLDIRYLHGLDGSMEKVAVSGNLEGGNGSPFTAWLTRRDAAWLLDSRIDRVRFDAPSGSTAPLTGAADAVKLQIEARPIGEAAWNLSAVAKSPTVNVDGVIEKNVSVALNGDVKSSPTIDGLLTLNLESDASRIKAVANLTLNPSTKSSATLTIERLSDGWLDLFNAKRPDEWPAVAGTKPRLTLTAVGQALPKSPWLRETETRFAVSGIHVDSPTLPFPLRNLRIEGTAASDVVDLKCRGQWADGWFSLAGTHTGAWMKNAQGVSKLKWAFAMRAEDFLTTLPTAADNALTTSARAAYEKRPFVEGDLAGSGTLVLNWLAKNGRPTPVNRSLEGRLALRRGRIVHPALPAPVTDLNITCQVTPERLDVRRVRGKFLETQATISASLRGNPYFWNRPVAECRIQTEFPIERAVRFAPEKYRERLAEIEPTGNLNATLAFAGPLRRPFRKEDIETSGVLVLRNAALHAPFTDLQGDIHHLNAVVQIAGDDISLDEADGWIDRVPFTINAEANLTSERLTATLESAAPSIEIQKVLPRVLRRYKVGGEISSSFTLTAWGAGLFEQAIRLKDLSGDALNHLPFHWNLEGEARPRDAELTFESFPSSLTALNGVVRLHNFEWTFTDLTGAFGKSRDCRIRGGGRFRPGNRPIMRVDLEAPVAYLDEWIRAWRKPPPRPPREPRPDNPVFELTGTLRSPKAFFRGHEGANFYSEFALHAQRIGKDTFRFYNARANLYEGLFQGRGTLEFDKGLSTNTLELQAQNVSLPPFLQCETGNEQTFAGRLIGAGDFRWLGGGGRRGTLTGQGRFVINESKFWSNVFFRGLAETTMLPFLDPITFNTIEAGCRIADRKVLVDEFKMVGPLIAMKGSGTAAFDHALDFYLELGIRRLPPYAALLNLVIQSFGKIPSSVFALDLTGTWNEPQFEFYHLGVAEKSIQSAIEQLWSTIAD